MLSHRKLYPDFVDKNAFSNHYCAFTLKQLANTHQTQTVFKKNQILFYEGQPANGVYIINSGKVKLWKQGVHSHEQIVRLAKEDDILGYRGCLEDTTFALSATVIDDSDICFIEKDIFFKALKSNPRLYFNILFYYAENLRELETRLRDMAEMNVREKVADAILLMKNAYSFERDNATLKVQLLRQEIAALAGISIDQTIKQLASFKQEKIIFTERKKIKILNLKSLETIVALYKRY